MANRRKETKRGKVTLIEKKNRRVLGLKNIKNDRIGRIVFSRHCLSILIIFTGKLQISNRFLPFECTYVGKQVFYIIQKSFNFSLEILSLQHARLFQSASHRETSTDEQAGRATLYARPFTTIRPIHESFTHSSDELCILRK